MIDKKIGEAATNYADSNWISDGCYNACEDGFVAGVKWFKKELWHNIYEVPKEPGRIIFDRGMYEPVTYQFSFRELQEWDKFIPSHAKRWSYYNDLFYNDI